MIWLCDPNWLTALAAVAGVLVALFGFLLTVCQLWRTRQVLQATNTYGIQKDARELARDIISDGKLLNYINAYEENKTTTKAVELRARQDMARVVQFYMSVYRQYKNNGITKNFAKALGVDFYMFLNRKFTQDYIADQLNRGIYGKEHQEMVRFFAESGLDRAPSDVNSASSGH